MHIEEIRRLLTNSGIRVLDADSMSVYIEDPSCILRGFETFLEYAWIIITAITGVLLFGWAVSMIRGAKNDIMTNIRNLFLMFAALSMVGSILGMIYGDDIFERVVKLSKMGRKVSLENQRMALDFLIETDCVSKELKLPSEYEKKLSNLIARQNIIEGRNLTHSRAEKKLSRTIKVFYPDHEHTMEHLNGTPHTHEHHHDHSSEYQLILERMHSEKSQEHKHTNEKNKNLNINYINEGE